MPDSTVGHSQSVVGTVQPPALGMVASTLSGEPPTWEFSRC